jgi:putative FmdB family regulatory protein
MPLYEYECRGCGHHFEYLTRAEQSPSCPACQGANLQKLLSVFAAHSDSPAKSFSNSAVPTEPCGSCGDPRGPGACSMN